MFLDIGMGILLAIAVNAVWHTSLAAGFVIGGIIFSLLMDSDFLFHLGRGGSSKNAHRHRDMLHYPMLYLPIGSALAYFIGGVPWAMLFFFASLSHFIHDSIGIGWGVQWLWPLRDEHYAFFYRYKPKHGRILPKKSLYIWKHSDIDALAATYGDEEWVKNIYLKFHPYAIIELLVFIVAVILLIFYVR